MQTAILNSNSKSDMKLLLELARKIGISIRILKESEIEDIGLAYAIKEGRTNDYVDVESYLKKLRK